MDDGALDPVARTGIQHKSGVDKNTVPVGKIGVHGKQLLREQVPVRYFMLLGCGESGLWIMAFDVVTRLFSGQDG